MSGIQQTLLGGSPAGYQIERSLRFNSADSAYLNRTPASAGNANTWTWSGWVKRSALGSVQVLFSAATDTNNFEYFRFESTDELFYTRYVGGAQQDGLTTTAVFRDPSAWYHIVVVRNGATRTIYVNNVSMASGGSNASTGEINQVKAHSIGRRQETASQYFSGYMTETYMIDGQALTPSSFGQSDPNTGVWSPIKYTGTYGTNGFYLNFSDNSNTTSTTLGKDYSGNGNNWTPNLFSVTAGTGNDSLVDTPTSYGTDTGVGGEVRGNYCTMNPLDSGSGITLANGNLDITTGTSQTQSRSTFAVSTGKWYAEVTTTIAGGAQTFVVGVSATTATKVYYTDPLSYGYSSFSGNKINNNSDSAYGSSYTTGDIIGIALDMDNGKVWFSKNGTWQASGNPASGTNQAFSGLVGQFVMFCQSNGVSNGPEQWNFGQRPFAYTAPSGFKALCTQNLPTPTIGATTTTQANRYFDATLYAGTATAGGAQTQNISVNFQPDFLWIKNRTSASSYHLLVDAVRGANSLSSNVIDAEIVNGNQSLTSTGYTVAGNAGTVQYNPNLTGNNYVGWVWNAGGSNATNTSGSITSTVRANTTAGFSIVTYTGTGVNATVGHGLGVVPSMIIAKRRSATQNWGVWHTSLTGTQTLYLDLTQGVATGVWNGTPTSTVFNITTDGVVNASTSTYVAYCFAAVAGYSAFGSYTGNGAGSSAGTGDGPFVYTGFRPRWIMVKVISGTTANWSIIDTARSPYNFADKELWPSSSAAESTYAIADILSNGFKLRSDSGQWNSNGAVYIYAAFAESPFKYSLAR